MNRPLILKFVTLYTLLTLSLFVVANTLGTHYIKSQLISSKKKDLNSYSQYIHEQYFQNIMDNQTIYLSQSASEQIQKTDGILHTRTWFVNPEGTLLFDAENEFLSKEYNILYYDKNYFQTYHHISNSLGTLLPEPMLSVILPVTKNFNMKGYIVIHYPMSYITEKANTYALLLNETLLAISLLMGGVLFFISRITIRPAKKLLTSVTSYNEGNYEQTVSLNGKDEFEKLSLELSYMGEQLKDLDNYQKNFIANVSHDFRSPLTSIKGYSEAMLDGTIPPELHNKYLDIILFESERLTKLTANLLSLNQFERGKSSLDITSFDINQIIKRTAASFEGACTQKHIKIKLTFSEKETFVNADQGKIQQVLYNLLDNAIKFSHKNSEIHIISNEKKEKVLISVKDFGIGIPKENLKKVWERFYKTDLSRGKDKKGTGLGLSITKEIINAHNETISVISTKEAGTEFSFTLALTTPNEI